MHISSPLPRPTRPAETARESRAAAPGSSAQLPPLASWGDALDRHLVLALWFGRQPAVVVHRGAAR